MPMRCLGLPMLLLAIVGCGMRREVQRAQALESVGQWD